MNKLKQLGLASMSALMLSTVALPTFANAQNSDEYYSEDLNSNPGLLNVEVDEAIELELSQVDYYDLFNTVSNNLNIADDQQLSGQITTFGLKTMAAKQAAKQMIKKLKNVGSRAWNEQIKVYVDKLPLTSKAKKSLNYYLSYQVVMEAFDILVDFSGTAEAGLSKALKQVGVPSYLADVTSRAIVFFLL
ncbi:MULTISPECIES: hypothetical protein [Peribacillus]|uniref:Uncharacterized protein n=1 Tax=Peribacillus simplex TaxID=1478 RepID=A0A120GNE5_9BACI|nr:hypothetical protein [Peribacillus simplex]KWW15471.1 hypothetical protein AS888_08025 [Peribacillus simplex]